METRLPRAQARHVALFSARKKDHGTHLQRFFAWLSLTSARRSIPDALTKNTSMMSGAHLKKRMTICISLKIVLACKSFQLALDKSSPYLVV